ncbi:putative reverse transcriptase domain-containing protein [Tanacetum coccineum]
MEAQIRALQRDVSVLQRQRIDDGDRLTTSHIQYEHDRKMAPKKTTTPMNNATIKQLIPQGVADALAEYEANRSSRNGDDSHDSGSARRTEHTTRECAYSDFLKCQPLTLKWNSHVKTVGHDAAYGMTWKTLMKMLTDKYCPRSKIKKLKIEIWNLKVKGTDIVSYTQHFQKLALMCGRMFPEESDQVDKYVGGRPDMIQGSVMASKPKTIQEAIKIANDLIDQKPYKRKNVVRAYAAGSGGKKESPAATANNQRALGAIQKVVTCYECGVQGHFKKDYLKLKNNNRGNQAGNGRAQARAYALGGNKANLDSNVVTGTFLLNNHYAFILFDSGADRSFVSTAFSSLIDIIPTTLNDSYDV